MKTETIKLLNKIAEMSSDSEVDENISNQQSEPSEQEEKEEETQATTNETPATWEDLVSFVYLSSMFLF